jgi:hypothetical protein
MLQRSGKLHKCSQIVAAFEKAARRMLSLFQQQPVDFRRNSLSTPKLARSALDPPITT